MLCPLEKRDKVLSIIINLLKWCHKQQGSVV